MLNLEEIAIALANKLISDDFKKNNNLINSAFTKAGNFYNCQNEHLDIHVSLPVLIT